MKVRKAVILAAGFGTRFLPATKAMPKEMLPIIDKPVIHFVVEEAINSGIKDIIIVTGRGKYNIENYFDRNPELEHLLHAKGDKEKLEQIEHISRMANIFYVRQKEPKGIPDAVACARDHIDGESFAVLTGDDFFLGAVPSVKQMALVHEKHGGSVIGCMRVPKSEIHKYGAIKGKEIEKGVFEVEEMVEKPSPEQAPSDIASCGRWIFTPEFFDCIDDAPLVKGEKWWPDVAKAVARKHKQKFYAKILDCEWKAVGDKANFVKATVEFGLKHADTSEAVREYLKELARKDFKP
ncbi:MAG: UTP--glucose-1-phosphate uridylyltransferase [Candidatus Micrarchaeia archaeon]